MTDLRECFDRFQVQPLTGISRKFIERFGPDRPRILGQHLHDPLLRFRLLILEQAQQRIVSGSEARSGEAFDRGARQRFDIALRVVDQLFNRFRFAEVAESLQSGPLNLGVFVLDPLENLRQMFGVESSAAVGQRRRTSQRMAFTNLLKQFVAWQGEVRGP